MSAGRLMKRLGLAHGPYWREHKVLRSMCGFTYTVTTLRPYYRWRWDR